MDRRPDGPDPECVFCLSAVSDGEVVREMRCRHVFHLACLVRPRATCPLCRDTPTPSSPRPRTRPARNAYDGADTAGYGFEFGGDSLSSSVHATAARSGT